MSRELHVVIAGGSGMIGRALTAALFADGHRVTILSRDARGTSAVRGATIAEWNPGKALFDLDALGTVDAIVNLAGESLSRMPWTSSRRTRIVSSRVDATRTLVDAIANATRKPSVLVNGSAVGIYGDRGNETLADSATEGHGFLADVVRAWEAAAREVDPSVRLVLARTGLVIASEGALTPLRKLAAWSLAGPLGRGTQWWPWIGIHDEVRALIHLITTRAISGPVNVVGPNPATAKDVVKALARRMHRLAWLPAPAFALRALLGKAADEMLLSSQKVVPTLLVTSGFHFDDATVDRAIARALLDVDRKVR